MPKLLLLLLSLAVFSSASFAQTLGDNPYYQQIQKNYTQAQAQATQAFDKKYPPPQLPKSSELGTTAPPVIAPPRIVTPPPIQAPSTSPPPAAVAAPPDLSVLNAQRDEQKDNANPAFNIFVPPTSNAEQK